MPSPVTIGRHHIRMLPDKNFECVECRLVAPDFQALESVPCKAKIQQEIQEQHAKLLRLKELQQRESQLKEMAARQAAATALPTSRPVVKPPVECLNLK